jgi:hypothetical protein
MNRIVCCHGHRTYKTPYEPIVQCYKCGNLWHYSCYNHYLINRDCCKPGNPGPEIGCLPRTWKIVAKNQTELAKMRAAKKSEPEPSIYLHS